MNISTQLCGLVIICLILYFRKRQPTMGLISEKRFLVILYSVLLCVLLDIFSCYTISHQDVCSNTLVVVIAKLYLASLITVAYAALSYIISDVSQKISRYSFKYSKIIFHGIYLASLLVLAFSQVYIHFDEDGLYSYGPATHITYFTCVVLIFLILIETFLHKAYIKAKRRRAIICWVFVWLISACIQFIFPQYLIVGFASCVGALIVFFEMENPESTISRRSGHFSSSVIREYYDFLYSQKKNFSVLLITFSTVVDGSEDSSLLKQTIDKLSDFLYTVENAKIFNTPEGYFILVFDNPNFIESTKYQIANYFQSIADDPHRGNAISLLSPYYIVVPDGYICKNSDEFMAVLNSFIPSDSSKLSSDTIVIDAQSIEDVKHRKYIETMVAEALDDNRIEVFYQPIYKVSTGTFTSAEALVRIRLKNGNLLAPGNFIPIVEQSGRIIALSEEIMQIAFSYMHLYHIDRLGVDYIEINLPVTQAENTAFPSRLADFLKKYDINGNMVNLEITETGSVRSKESILENMSTLINMGCHFSLDDFGSGSSNLNYIIDMPVKMVKLDKTLTDGYFENEKAAAIVKAVIEMAHSIGIEIVAEGIETKEHMDAMVELGVDYIQGYYFARPLDEHQFLSFIQTNNLKQNK